MDQLSKGGSQCVLVVFILRVANFKRYRQRYTDLKLPQEEVVLVFQCAGGALDRREGPADCSPTIVGGTAAGQ